MEIEDVADVVRKSRLRWFGHLERKDARDWVSACRNIAIVGNAGKGRPKKRLNEVVKDDLKKCSLDRGLAKDKERSSISSSYGDNVQPVRPDLYKGHKTRRDSGCKTYLHALNSLLGQSNTLC